MSGDLKAAASREQALVRAWQAYQRGEVPHWLDVEMGRALDALATAISDRDRTAAGNAAVDAAQSANDLQLRHRPQAEIDLSRYELWARQILVDATAGELGFVRGDVVTLEWVRDRFANVLDPVDLTRIDTNLQSLRESVYDSDFGAAQEAATELRGLLAKVEPAS